MRELTVQELIEPDVYLTIPHGLALPESVWDEIEVYIGRETPRGTVYRIPAYLARQLEFITKLVKDR